jgi:ABC-2 type transport system permease protein
MTGALAPYRAILSARFRMLLQYRAAAMAGLWTQIFFGLVFLMIYEAFYRSTSVPQPMTFPQVVSYVWLGQVFFAMLPWNSDVEIRAMVRTGGVAYELCRPIDLYNFWYARAIALRTAPTLLRAVPMAILAAFVLPVIGLEEWRLAPPPSAGSAVGFLGAFACTLVLGAAVTTLLNISLLWTIGADGVAPMVGAFVSFCSGMMIPIPLFPDWAQTILLALPFAGLVDLPFRVYTGHIAPQAAAAVFAHQLLWTAVLVLFGRWLLGRALRRVVAQGG